MDQPEIVSIRKSPSTNFKEDVIQSKGECISNQGLHDPSIGSPPNDFMIKLQHRMTVYFIADDQ
jgi:hypothetical protein